MLKEGQAGFDDRINTLGSKQNMLYSIKPPNKIKRECVVLRSKGDNVVYIKTVFNFNYLLSNMITIEPDGNIRVGK